MKKKSDAKPEMGYCPLSIKQGTGQGTQALGWAQLGIGAHAAWARCARGAERHGRTTGRLAGGTGARAQEAGARGSRRAGRSKGLRGAAGACGTALGAQGAGARGHGRCLGLPVPRLGMLAESVGPVWVFGAPDSL